MRTQQILLQVQKQQSQPPASTAITVRFQEAKALHKQGRLAEAEVLYREILAQMPTYSDAWHLLGVIEAQRKNSAAAVELIGRAITLNPDSAPAHDNLGIALRDLKRHEEALASYERALTLKPESPGTFYNRGNVLQDLKRHEAALASYDRALVLKPDFPQVLNNRGNLLQDLKRYEEAAVSYEGLLNVAPDYGYAAGSMLHSRLHCCDWRQYSDLAAKIADAVRNGKQADHPFSFLAVSQSAAAQLQCARIYTADQYPAGAEPLWTGERYPHERIRIAYMSADFYHHAIAYLTAELFEAHDKTRFETTAISLGPGRNDDMRERLRRSFEHFVDVRDQSDLEVAQMMRDREIDIVIDLNGYTQGARPGILRHRAAPLQVSYLGYPGTMGADYVDYIIADRHVIPAEDEAFYAEKVVRLPDTYQVNCSMLPVAENAPTRLESRLPDTGFVFCSFSNNYKITPYVFDIWMRLLAKVKGSVLWLLEDNAAASRNLRREAEERGVAAERLVFASRTKQDAHLARHRLADVFLDTLPYNAHATASDALRMGLPVVTCTGSTFAGRVAGSLLKAVGLPEMITHSLEGYEALALKLATEPEFLIDIKAKLARNRSTHALFRTDRFCRHIESAYVAMWEQYQQGNVPATFAVPTGQ